MEFEVHIVESPGPAEFLSNTQERDAMHHFLDQLGIAHRTYVAVNRDCFAGALAKVMESPNEGTNPRIPILHISAHGNEEGIALTDGQHLDWPSLARALTIINSALGGRLILSMSSCSGASCLKAIKLEGDHPFHTLVGPKISIGWRDSLVAFTAFYNLLVRKGALPTDAAAAMNVAAGVDAGTFVAVSSDDYRRFLKDEMRKNELKEIIEKLQAGAAKVLKDGVR
jgi:hypothetical protein